MDESEARLSDPGSLLGLLLIIGLLAWGAHGCWRSVTKPAAPNLVGISLATAIDNVPDGVDFRYVDSLWDLDDGDGWPEYTEVEVCKQHPASGKETWSIKVDLQLAGQCSPEPASQPEPSRPKADSSNKPGSRFDVPDRALAESACNFAVVLSATDGVPLSDALADAAVTAGVDKATMLFIHSNGCTAN